MMQNRLWMNVAIASALALVLAACGTDENRVDSGTTDEDGATGAADTNDQTTDEDRLTLGFAPASYDFTDFFGQLDFGIREGLDDHGVDYEVFMRAPSDVSAHEEYASNVSSLVALQPDYIVAAPSQLDLHVETFRDVNDAGIPIIFAQPDTVDGIDAIQFAGSSNFNAGEVAADYITELVGDGGTVALLHGQAGSFVDEGRVVHARTLLEEAGVEVVAAEYADFGRDTAFNLTEDILTLHPDVDLIYAGSSDMALGAMTAVENAGLDTPVIGVGGIIEELEMIVDGRLHATIFRDPAMTGRGIADTIVMHTQDREDEIEFVREFDHEVIDSCERIVEIIPPLLFEAADLEFPTC